MFFKPFISSFILLFICFDSLMPHPFLSTFSSALTSLQCYSDSIVSLCWDLNFSPSTSNSLQLVLHFSCSLLLKVCTNLSPSQSSQFIIIGTFLFPCMLFTIKNMFLTSISKLFNSLLISCAVQSNDGCFNTGLLTFGVNEALLVFSVWFLYLSPPPMLLWWLVLLLVLQLLPCFAQMQFSAFPCFYFKTFIFEIVLCESACFPSFP